MNQSQGTGILGVVVVAVPLMLAAAWVAGAAAARRLLRREMDELRTLVAAQQDSQPVAAVPPVIEAESTPAAATAPASAPVPAPDTARPMEPQAAPIGDEAEGVTPETILVLSAAVAAFLGKKARIRRARLLSVSDSNVWAQQGRVFVQASHNLGLQHRGN